jgi:thiol-disulfide isomerase/thioredoxin
MEAKTANGYLEMADERQKTLLEYTKLNYMRSLRIQKTYRPSQEIKTALRNIRELQIWMVLTEDWCGDSAQTLPFIACIAEENPNIHLKILPRDENPDIMDLYLTGGKRAVPKLVAFSKTGEELFHWGPRPQAAAEIFREGLTSGLPKKEIYPKLHLWYGRDRGKTVEKEFLEILVRFGGEEVRIAAVGEER